jgi:lipid II:glycine glycyltransferase (peptidoglycan interpeptide bridge formation enzyme)
MNVKQQYIEWSINNEIPLFARPTWLDACCKQWDVVSVKEEDFFYFLPYTIDKKYGFSFIRNPHLTPYTYIVTTNVNIFSEVVNQLILQLPKVDYVELDFYQTVDFDCLQKMNFEISSKKTHLLDITEDINLLYKRCKEPLKRQIKKATKNLTITAEDDIDLMYTMYKKTFEKQKTSASIPFHHFYQLWEYCKNHQCGTLFFSKDNEGNCHAAYWLVYDNSIAYYLVGGTDASYYGSGAMSALMWHAIEFSKISNKSNFDFEGSIIENIARFFRNFNPTEYLYPSIYKCNSILLKAYYRIKK